MQATLRSKVCPIKPFVGIVTYTMTYSYSNFTIGLCIAARFLMISYIYNTTIYIYIYIYTTWKQKWKFLMPVSTPMDNLTILYRHFVSKMMISFTTILLNLPYWMFSVICSRKRLNYFSVILSTCAIKPRVKWRTTSELKACFATRGLRICIKDDPVSRYKYVLLA